MKTPPSDDNFRILPDGNIVVSDLDSATDEQRAFFFEELEQELFRLSIERQCDGRN